MLKIICIILTLCCLLKNTAQLDLNYGNQNLDSNEASQTNYHVNEKSTNQNKARNKINQKQTAPCLGRKGAGKNPLESPDDWVPTFFARVYKPTNHEDQSQSSINNIDQGRYFTAASLKRNENGLSHNISDNGSSAEDENTNAVSGSNRANENLHEANLPSYINPSYKRLVNDKIDYDRDNYDSFLKLGSLSENSPDQIQRKSPHKSNTAYDNYDAEYEIDEYDYDYKASPNTQHDDILQGRRKTMHKTYDDNTNNAGLNTQSDYERQHVPAVNVYSNIIKDQTEQNSMQADQNTAKSHINEYTSGIKTRNNDITSNNNNLAEEIFNDHISAISQNIKAHNDISSKLNVHGQNIRNQGMNIDNFDNSKSSVETADSNSYNKIQTSDNIKDENSYAANHANDESAYNHYNAPHNNRESSSYKNYNNNNVLYNTDDASYNSNTNSKHGSANSFENSNNDKSEENSRYNNVYSNPSSVADNNFQNYINSERNAEQQLNENAKTYNHNTISPLNSNHISDFPNRLGMNDQNSATNKNSETKVDQQVSNNAKTYGHNTVSHLNPNHMSGFPNSLGNSDHDRTGHNSINYASIQPKIQHKNIQSGRNSNFQNGNSFGQNGVSGKADKTDTNAINENTEYRTDDSLTSLYANNNNNDETSDYVDEDFTPRLQKSKIHSENGVLNAMSENEMSNDNCAKSDSYTEEQHLSEKSSVSDTAENNEESQDVAVSRNSVPDPASGDGITKLTHTRKLFHHTRICYACSTVNNPTCWQPDRRTTVKYCPQRHDSCITKSFLTSMGETILTRDCGRSCGSNNVPGPSYNKCSTCHSDLCNDVTNGAFSIKQGSLIVSMFLIFVIKHAT